MENRRTFKTPLKTLARMQVVHFGKILFGMQFIALAVMVASIVSAILPAIYYLLLICIALLTLFALFADPTFKAMWAGGETLTKIATVLMQSWKYTLTIVAVLSIASIVCLSFDKSKKQIARIVISSVILAIEIFILLAKLANSGVLS